ncbi:T9SS C-terminal target domain-containing protein [Flavobacterium magnum]|uniref:T9SS C-terminal target domain-containing protein n=1 Tax=Flavobacterium magnum TaxID=2162713 RepID=A0A2S0RG08_9FLAO|nr:T9SS type A sorting domain-containing protein [Flavobacterium magnum]AWA30031.1 T9SS C-terminal target domain-containing protein [Flavobacterium magnum]
MKKVFFLLPALICTGLRAQQSTVAGGGNATGSGGTVSYSVGQISYKSPDSALITVGVQQPYEIIVLGKDELPGIQLLAYPNPVRNNLTLKNADDRDGSLTYSLSDITGKVLLSPAAFSGETLVAMQQYPPGIYLITICGSDKKIKTFKIIKK